MDKDKFKEMENLTEPRKEALKVADIPRPVQQIEFDLENAKVISVNGIKLLGECKRCGACCRDFFEKPHFEATCPFLTYRADGYAHCMTYETRPMICVMFPNDPEQALPETCGYYWGEEE